MTTENSNKRLKAIIVPQYQNEKSQNEVNYSLITMIHPRSRLPTRFMSVPGSPVIYELTSITGARRAHKTGFTRPSDISSEKSRSLLIQEKDSSDSSDAYVVSDPSLIISTPINPIFFTLSVLYNNKTQYLQPDHLHDLLESESSEINQHAKTLDYELFRKIAGPICDSLTKENDTPNRQPLSETNLYRLSIPKLFEYFDKIVSRILTAGLPADIYKQMVVDPLLPPDITKEIDSEMVTLATHQATLNIIGSYIPHEIFKEYYSTKEEQFITLDKHKSEIEKQKTIAIEQQNLLALSITPSKKRGLQNLSKTESNKKPASKPKPAKGLAKANKSGIRSLNSFFKSAPAAK